MMEVFNLLVNFLRDGKMYFSLILLLTCTNLHVNTKSASSRLAAESPGDIILGGLFPIHTTGTSMCSVINPERGIQRLEAMLFTIDEINNNTKLLPGLKMGAIIRDTCSATNYALEQALHFVLPSSLSDKSTPSGPAECGGGGSDASDQNQASYGKPITRGVVGSSYSSVSILVAILFRLFGLPQISYASTSAVLSDKRSFPLFARTVPSDVVQARAMATLVSAHNWTYVSTVRSAGDYGDSGMDAFWKEADKLGVCIAAREVIRGNSGNEDLDTIVRVLRYNFGKARVVVMFTGMDHTKLLLDAVRRAGLVDYFVWIASDGWGRENLPVSNNSRVANGALTIEIQAKPVTAFNEHYLNLGYDNKRNPWFRKYWEELFGCTFETKRVRRRTDALHRPIRSDSKNTARQACKLDPNLRLRDRLGPDFKQEAKIQFVYDAVYAFASGWHRLQENLCPGDPYDPRWDKKLCVSRLLNFSGTEFYKTMINTSFTDKYGNYVAFDENGDGYGQYSIYNYARHPYTGQYHYRLVGDYQGGQLTMRARPIWPGGQSNQLPVSQCSEECGFAEIRLLDKKQQCCWSCIPCTENQRMVNLTNCEACEPKHWPTPNRTSCMPLTLHYIDVSTWFAIVPMTFSSVGICITILVIVTWRVFSETPIVRATGRELAYVQLSGCMVSYAASFILLASPSVFICSMQRILIGLGFAMMYASLLTKTNRIARIFDAAKRTIRRPVYISPRSQLIIAGSMITLQLALSAIWFGFDPPDTRIDPIRADYLVLRCAMKDKSFLVSLAYNMVLIVVCTAYAIKTRQIPENFNESKFIGFAMYTTCIIWLAFLPMYYATMNNHEIQITTLCISISLSASVMLCCLFIPKLYLIYVHPEKNVRRLTMNNPKAKQRIRDLTQQITASKLNNANNNNNNNTNNNTTNGQSKANENKIGMNKKSSLNSPITIANMEGNSDVNLANRSFTRLPTVTDTMGTSSSRIEEQVSQGEQDMLIPQNMLFIQPVSSTTVNNYVINPTQLTSPAIKANAHAVLANSRSGGISRPTGRSQNEFPTPIPLLLDSIPNRVIQTPAYCVETSSNDSEMDEAGTLLLNPSAREPFEVAMTYQYGLASNSSQILSNPYALPYSGTNSLLSEDTPRSSDVYMQSFGEETQTGPGCLTSQSPSVTSGPVFDQMREPNKTPSRVDYSKQTVTAL